MDPLGAAFGCDLAVISVHCLRARNKRRPRNALRRLCNRVTKALRSLLVTRHYEGTSDNELRYELRNAGVKALPFRGRLRAQLLSVSRGASISPARPSVA